MSADDQVLYRFWNGEQLLYVGISSNAYARIKQHSRTAEFWPHATHVTFERFATREEVEAAEIAAIRSEHPTYNITHSTDRPTHTGRYEYSVGERYARNVPAGLSLEEHVAWVVSDAPPLTPEQVERLSALLSPVGRVAQSSKQSRGHAAKSAPGKQWVTLQEAADYWEVSIRTIRRQIHAGRLEASRVGSQVLRVSLDSLQSLGNPVNVYGGD